MKLVKTLLSLVLFSIVAAIVFIYSGAYNVAGDDPHWRLTEVLLKTLRERSIEKRMQDVKPPRLDDPKLVAAGAEHYPEMCAGCHLAPGVEETELRTGLYPKPPDLTKHAHGDVVRQFWIIKHGIKLTGMPAWGTTHDNDAIWGLVAFLQKLPGMSQEQYKALAGEGSGHSHGHSNAEGSKDTTQERAADLSGQKDDRIN